MPRYQPALEACPDCDLLLKRPRPAAGEKAHCPRCGCLLRRPHSQSIEKTLALSITGLILAVPANFMPLLSITIFGKGNAGTLWSGVIMLVRENMELVAILVFLSSIVLPVANLVLSLLISVHLYLAMPSRFLPLWMRWLQHFEEWAMLEVYMLGIIVAYVKLSSLADLKLGLGLYAFIGLLVITLAATYTMDRHLFWRHIGQLQRKRL